MSNLKKEQILIESFNVLQEDITENVSALADIVIKLYGINKSLSIEMWEHLLKNGKESLQEDGYYLTENIRYGIEKEYNLDNNLALFLDNKTITEYYFGQSSHLDSYEISKYFEVGEIEFVDSLITLLYSNPNKERSFEYYLLDICNDFKGIFSECFKTDDETYYYDSYNIPLKIKREYAHQGKHIVFKWMDLIDDKKIISKMRVAMIDYI